MITTAKEGCNILADLIVAHGVTQAVLSPGSRNVPLIVAISRNPDITTRVVTDERSAAFIALGLASVSGRPVALVCTSGTALLNYAPAVAEAFYRRIPLIVISADRPAAWIDQDDSQTIKQPGALDNIVKRSCSLKAELHTPDDRWHFNRVVNDVLLAAVNRRLGPVHINVTIDTPIDEMTDRPDRVPVRVIRSIRSELALPRFVARLLARAVISSPRVMIVAGFEAPDRLLSNALARLARNPNVVVLAENIANLHSPLFITAIDRTLSSMPRTLREELVPDIVITLGGALVSRFIKSYLRENQPREHWHVGDNEMTIDCFKCLTRRIELPPMPFFTSLLSAMRVTDEGEGLTSDYRDRWAEAARLGEEIHARYVADAPWSDLVAFDVISRLIPRKWNLQVSNGTSVRYSQLFSFLCHRIDCNRGVSGIDGTTSTAVGASLAYSGVTLLISGDMSAAYDLSAVASGLLTPRFKMIVIDNSGGGIFRFIAPTRSLPEREEYLSACVPTPWAQIAEGFGIACFEADSRESLPGAFHAMAAVTDRPALLVVHTDPDVSPRVLIDYFHLKF
ncbi:MAG: 2-succinyl-5-enolpyruvyl-6-hydroxy-3-cyclohexene-1-carboxylic-acid synthase [Muribaculaceae bacterium]|nr:2-succinyl-5-enolpyruvyl-6-hydroxy-3-cyclohexene-1-carboxylic-acid synthase [Muribaculaceae bacterium]